MSSLFPYIDYMLRSAKPRLTSVEILCAGHATPAKHKRTSVADRGEGPIGIFRLRTDRHGVFVLLFDFILLLSRQASVKQNGACKI